jgi:hypothetical protein
LEVIYEEFRVLWENGEQNRAARLLQERWAEIDPVAAVEFLKSHDQWWWRGGVFCEWVQRDFETAVAGLTKVSETAEGWTARVAMMELLKRAEPDLCLRFLRATGAFEFTNGNEESAGWRKLAEARPKELLAVIEEFVSRKKAKEMWGVVSIMGRVMAEGDPGAAIAWGSGLPNELRKKALLGAMSTWGRSDPQAVISKLAEWKEHGTGPIEAEGMLSSLEYGLIESLANQDFGAAVQWQAEKGWGSSTYQLGRVAAARWRSGELSLGEIYDEVAGAEEAPRYSLGVFFEELWGGAGRRSLNETLALLQGQPEGEVRTVAVGKLWENALAHEPMEAARLISSMAAGEGRDEVVKRLCDGMEIYGFHEKFLMTLPLGVRAVGLAALYAKPKEQHLSWGIPLYPGNVVEGISEVKDVAIREEAIARVGRQWGGLDPKGALAWVMELEGDDQKIAIREAAQGWAEVDATGLAASLETTPDGASRDLMVVGLTQEVSDKDPEGAWLWGGTIGDDQLGREVRARVFEIWAKRDEAAAREALESSEIGRDEREALRAILE